MPNNFDSKKIYKKSANKMWLNMVVVFLMVVAAFFVYPPFAVCEALIFIVLLIYNILLEDKRKSEMSQYIENLSLYFQSSGAESIINLPLPVAIVELNGSILWYNKAFSSIGGEGEIFGLFIQEVAPQIQLSKFIEAEYGPDGAMLVHNSKVYNVIGNIVEHSDGADKKKRLILYWIDKTEEDALRTKYIDDTITECIVMIDNYDDVMQNTPDTSRASLMSEIEGLINTFASQYDGMIKMYERDKYLVLFSNSNLQRIIENKFDILERIREIDNGNKIPITLSIGVGKNGENMIENDKFARVAIDMALGRGGDQAVIKDNKAFEFYGAKSRELEKRTKVKARVVAHAMKGLMQESDKVIIMGHQNPDLDSVGASLGLFRIAKYTGKDAYMVLGNVTGTSKTMVNNLWNSAEYSNFIISGEQAANMFTKNTLLIIVDTHRPSFVEYPDLLYEAEKVVMIDHHRRGAEFLENAVVTYHEPYASSTCEMVTEILQYISDNVGLLGIEAEALYAGMVMDTKSFTVKTGVRTFEAAAYLRRLGVDTSEIKKLFKNNLDMFIKKAAIISQARILRENIAVSSIEINEKDAPLLAAQAADELLNISGITASFVLAKLNDIVYISGRSLGDINVQVILEKLGGGGHMTVAGAQIECGDLKKAEEMLQNAINESLEE